MSKHVSLKAARRTAKGRNAVKKVKAAEAVPAILYGSGLEPTPLQLERRAVDKLLSHAVGENILVNLEIEGEAQGGSRLALINEIQHHPVSRMVLHLDFKAVAANEALLAEVVIEPFGEAAGVKNSGGLLEQSLRSVEVECLPQDLPESIRVDVSALELGQALHVRDLPVLPGVQYTAAADVTVFLVSEPKVSVESTTAEGGPTEPEVINEKKSEDAAEGKESAKKD